VCDVCIRCADLASLTHSRRVAKPSRPRSRTIGWAHLGLNQANAEPTRRNHGPVEPCLQRKDGYPGPKRSHPEPPATTLGVDTAWTRLQLRRQRSTVNATTPDIAKAATARTSSPGRSPARTVRGVGSPAP
jgi:hypothetical protein